MYLHQPRPYRPQRAQCTTLQQSCCLGVQHTSICAHGQHAQRLNTTVTLGTLKTHTQNTIKHFYCYCIVIELSSFLFSVRYILLEEVGSLPVPSASFTPGQVYLPCSIGMMSMTVMSVWEHVRVCMCVRVCVYARACITHTMYYVVHIQGARRMSCL